MENQSSQYYIQRSLYSLERYTCYEAVHRESERYVLLNRIQLYYSDPPEILTDCEREIRRWGMLNHENLPQPIDGWIEEKQLNFIWLAPRGISLESLIKSRRSFGDEQIYDIAFQTASLLYYLHKEGFFHGSLRSDCFTLSYDKWITLIRPGLAKRINYIFEKAETGFEKQQDRRKLIQNDISMWGSIIGALLTGEQYFGYKGDTDVSDETIDLEQLSIRRINPQISEKFEQVVIRSLHSAQSSGKGYSSFEELYVDLHKLDKTYFFSQVSDEK